MQGQEFGRYRLERLIGSGGMGDVYEATDLERDRVVALKLLPELFSGNAEFLERFRRESRVAARLRDPHIIPIHDYGEIDGRLYIDMRLVDDGVTVAGLLRDEGALAPGRTVALLSQVAEALDAAHADGLVHRDVKPSNVLVTPRDFVYVVDFGIAHAIGHTNSGLTMSGSTVGTLDYMAPERFRGRTVDRRADVYALGCLLFQCLTARTPFAGEDLPTLMYAHLDQPPPAPSEHRPGLTSALDGVVAVAMAKDPEHRYGTAGALAAAARRALAPDHPVAHAEPPVAPTATRGTTRPNPTPAVPTPAVPTSAVPTSVAPAAAPSPDIPGSTSGPAAGPVRYRRDGTTTSLPRLTRREVAAWLGRLPRGALVGVAAVLVLALVVVVSALTRPASRAASATVPPTAAAAVAAPSVAVPEVVGTIATPPAPGYLGIAPDGRRGYVTNRDSRTVSVVDLERRQVVGGIATAAAPRFVAFSADGARMFVTCYDEVGDAHLVHVVDTRTNAVTATVPVDREPYAAAVAPDRRTLWVPSHDTGSIDLVDVARGAVTGRIPVAANPHWVAFGPRGAYVANHESNLVTVLGLDGTARATVPVGLSPHALAVSPDGGRVAVVNYDGGTVSVIDTSTDRVVATVPVGRGPQHVAYTVDGRFFYTANVDDGTVSVVDTTTNGVTATVPVCASPTSVSMLGPEAFVTCLDESRLVVLRTAA